MNEEEKKALQKLQAYKDYKTTYWGYGTWLKVEVKTDKEYSEAIDIVSNLIEKQQKEIEKLKEINEKDRDMCREFIKEYPEGFINKQIIRNKIEKIKSKPIAICTRQIGRTYSDVKIKAQLEVLQELIQEEN